MYWLYFPEEPRSIPRVGCALEKIQEREEAGKSVCVWQERERSLPYHCKHLNVGEQVPLYPQGTCNSICFSCMQQALLGTPWIVNTAVDAVVTEEEASGLSAPLSLSDTCQVTGHIPSLWDQFPIMSIHACAEVPGVQSS